MKMGSNKNVFTCSHSHVMKQTLHVFFCDEKKTLLGFEITSYFISDFIIQPHPNELLSPDNKNSFFFFNRIHNIFLMHNNFFFIFHKGISSLSTLTSLTDPERLPELPPGEEQRLQRAALHLQQKLILRQWLKDNRLEQHYTRHAHCNYC